jgi:multidrug efflux system outer membrane protein
VREVENALASVSKDGERLTLLERSAYSAAAADEQIRYSWKAGEASILDVLEADRARFVAEAALADSDMTVRLDRAVLFAAIGG